MKYAKSEKARRKAVFSVGLILFVMSTWNRYCIIFDHTYKGHPFDAYFLIPDSFCGLGNILLGLIMMIGKKDNKVFHFLCYVCFWGGLLNMVYPTYLSDYATIFHLSTIFGLIHHSIACYSVILLLCLGYFKPTLKKFPCLIIGFCAFMTYGIFIMDALHFKDAMFIHKPLVADSILTWYFVGALITITCAFIMWLFDYLRQKRLVP